MAGIFFVRDGSDDDRANKVKDMDVAELAARLDKYECQHLGTKPPSFSSAQPSRYYSYVVVEITEADQKSEKFRKGIGFYFVKDLRPSGATFLVE